MYFLQLDVVSFSSGREKRLKLGLRGTISLKITTLQRTSINAKLLNLLLDGANYNCNQCIAIVNDSRVLTSNCHCQCS